ncbi:MAG: hypothetical protein K0S18_1367 [Anaerocolumna sp.]|jgi:hypothetical protein|nr:hypothetical protein [Anaerocolumna sp.]
MNLKNIFKERWISVYILLFIAILYFIYSLSFMTPFYRMFFDGDSLMFDLYKELQYLNQFIFEVALTTLILTIILLLLDVDKKVCNVFRLLFLIGFLVYEVDKLNVYIGNVPYFQTTYLSMDFSVLENYTASTVMFTLSYVFGISILVALLITTLLVLNGLVKMIRAEKGVKANG